MCVLIPLRHWQFLACLPMNIAQGTWAWNLVPNSTQVTTTFNIMIEVWNPIPNCTKMRDVFSFLFFPLDARLLFWPVRYFHVHGTYLDHFSICACHPCAGAMLIFSILFQFYQLSSKRLMVHISLRFFFLMKN